MLGTTIKDAEESLFREVLPLPWIQFKSLTVIMLMTLRHMPVKEAVFYHCPKALRACFLTIALSIGVRLTVHILVSKPK